MSHNLPPALSDGLDAETGWFHEGTVPGRRHGNVNHGFRLSAMVHSGRTAYQDVLIFDNPVYGRVLTLDGIVQLSTFDEYRYHEMLVHPPMVTHPAPRTVLIVGGGDGGTLREALRHNPERVVMIDIDGEFVQNARRYLPTLSQGAFEDPRVTLLHEDAAEAIHRYKNEFDIVIVDGNDEMGPSVPLFGAPFYAAVKQALRRDGLCAVQVGSFLDPDFIANTKWKISLHLPKTAPFHFTMPSYHCGDYCFAVAATEVHPAGPSEAVLAERLAARGIRDLKFYSPALHHASQILPSCLTW